MDALTERPGQFRFLVIVNSLIDPVLANQRASLCAKLFMDGDIMQAKLTRVFL